MISNVFVLILILLEYGLQQVYHFHKETRKVVLILILLEYGLQLFYEYFQFFESVLILILLEYGLQPLR